MNNTSRKLIAGIFIIFCTFQLLAQSNECDPDQTLSHAESEFSAGHFYSIPSILQKCLQSRAFSSEQRVRAYLILCQTYLIIDDPIAAEDSYLKLLEADPEYVADEKRDPIDIVYLSKKFTATPIFTPHFRAGGNTSFFHSIYSISTEPYEVSHQKLLRLGLQVGAGIDWNINDNLSLCTEINFSSRSYKRIISGIAGSDEGTVTGIQSWFDVPLYLKYADNRDKKIRPFGYLGFAINYLASAKNDFLFVDNKPITAGTQLVAEGPSEDVTYQRNLFNRSWIVGGGIKYKIGKDFLYADLRYMGGLSNIALTNKIYYQNPDNVDKGQIGNPDAYFSNNVTKYRFVSDIYRLDNLSLSFGFIHPIYDPRKVKKVKTKGVARKIIKEEGGIQK